MNTTRLTSSLGRGRRPRLNRMWNFAGPRHFLVHVASCFLKHSSIFYKIIRVHSGFSLVEKYDLLEDRRTLTPFQRQLANHSNFRIIDSQWRALFCIDHDHVKWRAKVFVALQSLSVWQNVSHFYHEKRID